jgi:hypothetical protein
MDKFAVDLVWVRYGKIGGGVAVVLNLLDGLQSLKEDFQICLHLEMFISMSYSIAELQLTLSGDWHM